MRALLTLLMLISAAGPNAAAQSRPDVRAEFEKAYQENSAAFMRWDLAGVMALRAPDFHTVNAMESRKTGRRWSSTSRGS